MPKYQFTVEVQPEYLPDQSSPEADIFSFAYTITVTNVGDIAGQLIARHWVICDANGHAEEVRGLGVVGNQPLLKPGQSFQYSSGCRLRTPTGTMHGRFFCMADDAERFDVPVALFVLEAADAPSGSTAPRRVLH